MKRLIALLAVFAAAAGAAAAAPARVVSLDYCADQYVLALADRAQIAAVSIQARDRHAFLRDRAVGLRRVRDAAEDVLALEPDLIVRAYGGGARARAYYARFGLRVHDLGFQQSFADIEATIRATAAALGRPERGERLIEQMRADLEAAGRGPRLRALYLTPAGATTGAGTLMHRLLEAANLENVAAEAGATGWRSLPLEALVAQAPDVIVAGFFDPGAAARDSWGPARHPIFRRLLEMTPVIPIDGAQLACASWPMAAAARRLRQGADAAGVGGGRP